MVLPWHLLINSRRRPSTQYLETFAYTLLPQMSILKMPDDAEFGDAEDPTPTSDGENDADATPGRRLFDSEEDDTTGMTGDAGDDSMGEDTVGDELQEAATGNVLDGSASLGPCPAQDTIAPATDSSSQHVEPIVDSGGGEIQDEPESATEAGEGARTAADDVQSDVDAPHVNQGDDDEQNADGGDVELVEANQLGPKAGDEGTSLDRGVDAEDVPQPLKPDDDSEGSNHQDEEVLVVVDDVEEVAEALAAEASNEAEGQEEDINAEKDEEEDTLSADVEVRTSDHDELEAGDLGDPFVVPRQSTAFQIATASAVPLGSDRFGFLPAGAHSSDDEKDGDVVLDNDDTVGSNEAKTIDEPLLGLPPGLGLQRASDGNAHVRRGSDVSTASAQGSEDQDLELDPQTLADMQQQGVIPADKRSDFGHDIDEMEDEFRRLSFPQVEDGAADAGTGFGGMTAEEAAAAAAVAAMEDLNVEAELGFGGDTDIDFADALGGFDEDAANDVSEEQHADQRKKQEQAELDAKIAELQRKRDEFENNIVFDPGTYAEDPSVAAALLADAEEQELRQEIDRHESQELKQPPPGLGMNDVATTGAK